MISSELSVAAEQTAVSRNRLILVVYTLAIFVSALLLFSVQPLFTKMVLRRLAGGVVGGDGVFPVAAARRLCLCAFSDQAQESRDAGRGASAAARRRPADAAIVDRGRMGRAADLGLRVLAARVVRDFD